MVARTSYPVASEICTVSNDREAKRKRKNFRMREQYLQQKENKQAKKANIERQGVRPGKSENSPEAS
jgi:hypothetical protein